MYLFLWTEPDLRWDQIGREFADMRVKAGADTARTNGWSEQNRGDVANDLVSANHALEMLAETSGEFRVPRTFGLWNVSRLRVAGYAPGTCK